MLTSISLPPLNFWMINFLTFSLIFIFLIKKIDQHRSKKLFFFYGWLFGFGYFFSNLYWISISLSFDKTFNFLIPITIFLIPAFLAVFYGLVFYLFLISRPKKIIFSFLIFSLVFGSIEFLRGSILSGFPWNLIVFSFSNQLEVIRITSILGTYGLNLLCISLFLSPAIIILQNNKINFLICSFFFIIFVFFFILGLSNKEKFENAQKETFDYKIRIVSSNISLDRFYLDIDTDRVVQELIKISSPEAKEKTIFVWPEGIFPGIYQSELNTYKPIFINSFSENHLLILGTNTEIIENGSKKYFNSLSVYDNELNLLDNYDKIKLVPFGEFLPLENILKIFGLKSLTNNYQSFSPGLKRQIIEIDQAKPILKILPLICYEIIYSGKLFKNPNFDIMINISEDGWFGQSIGPKQHFVHSIFRSIESGKYVVRSANNGIAAVINPLGEVEQKVEFGKTGYVELKEIKKIQPTIFSLYGNKIFGILILLYIFLAFSFNKIRNE